MKHEFKDIEQKWQSRWDDAKIFEAQDNSEKPKFFAILLSQK